MPRRKKSGQSPARVPGGPLESGSLGPTAAYQQTATANNFPGGGTSLSSSAREDTVRTMQEMFAHLDPEVIFIVLSECDFKGETQNARVQVANLPYDSFQIALQLCILLATDPWHDKLKNPPSTQKGWQCSFVYC